jgi:integrase
VDIIEFMAGTGCRIGEAIAMHWKDINLTNSTVTIRATTYRVPKQGLVRQDHGKTESSQRTITVPTQVATMLQTRLERGNHNALVFPTILGHKNPSMTQDKYMSKTAGSTKAAKALSQPHT